MSYQRKTIDRWDVMANYNDGSGWFCECSCYDWPDAKKTVNDYRRNGGGIYRLEKHREKIGG